MNTFHRYMAIAIPVLAFMLLLVAVLRAAENTAPTPLAADEVSQAAEAAILVQSAQIQAMQAQQRLEETSQRYQQLVGELRAKHNAAAGCNLTAAQKWSCPPAPAAAAKEPADGNGNDPSPSK